MYGYQSGLWWGHQESDYALIGSWGFNVVRLPIAWSYIEPTPGQYNDSYFSNYVDRDIGWAEKNSIYIMLDMHQDGWSPYFTFPGWSQNGLPAWAVSSYPNTQKGQTQAKLDFWNGLGPNGTKPSESNPSLQDRLAAAWKHVAARYAGKTAIVAFDLFNEPTICSQCYQNITNFQTVLAEFYEKAIDAIRSVDSNRICVWEGDTTLPTVVPNRLNLAYSEHYPGGGVYGYGGLSAVEAAVQREVSMSQSWGMPLFIGEWGIVNTCSALTQYIYDNLALFDQYEIGSAWWAYSKGDFGMYLFDGQNNMRTSITSYLIRPYLRGYANPIKDTDFDTVTATLQVNLQNPLDLQNLLVSTPSDFSIMSTTNIALTTSVGGYVVSVTPVDQASSILIQF